MRTLPAAVETSIAQNTAALFVFFKLEFGDGTLYLHAGEGAIDWGGFTWLGAGRVGQIELMKENEAGAVPGFILSISGTITAYIAEALGTQYRGRPVTCYVGFGALPDLTLIDTPTVENGGKMDTMPIHIKTDPETGARSAVIAVTVENEMFDFDRPNPWLWSNEAQQKAHPGDRFLEYVAQMSDRQIIWPNREWFKR